MDPIVHAKYRNINIVSKLKMNEDNRKRENSKRTNRKHSCKEIGSTCLIDDGVRIAEKCVAGARQQSGFFYREIPRLEETKEIINVRDPITSQKISPSTFYKSSSAEQKFKDSADFSSNFHHSAMSRRNSPTIVKQYHQFKPEHLFCRTFDLSFDKRASYDRFSVDHQEDFACDYFDNALTNKNDSHRQIYCVPEVKNNIPDICKKKLISRVGCYSRENLFEKKEERRNFNVQSRSLTNRMYEPLVNISSDKISLIDEVDVSAHSEKSNTFTLSRKQFNELLSLENSKCDAISVIDDCLSRVENSQNEILPAMQFKNSTTLLDGPSQTAQYAKEKTINYNDILSSDFLNNMFKEYRGYHLENMKQEIKRIQYLDSLPEKFIKKAESPVS